MSAQKGIALVTGGAKRIGKAISMHLAKQGWSVAVHYNSAASGAQDTVDEIQQMGGTAAAFSCDLTDRTQTKSLILDVQKAFGGPVNLLINNASMFEQDSLQDFDDALWDAHFSLHITAPMILTQMMAKALRGEAGNVINIIDQRVLKLNPQFFSYTLSKSTLWTATQTAAQALAPTIRVNAIGPGPALPSIHQTQESFDAEQRHVPLEKGTCPDEIARAISFILDTTSMTGQMIALDGGQHLAWQTPDIEL